MVVISLILVDNESLVDMLYYDAFSRMGLALDQLGKLFSLLIGFLRDAAPIEGIITLPVMVGQESRQAIV